jgi:hypothetical protein
MGTRRLLSSGFVAPALLAMAPFPQNDIKTQMANFVGARVAYQNKVDNPLWQAS